MPPVLCACGCGLPVIWKGARFRRGHSSVRDPEGWKPKERLICACGCGQLVKTPGRKVLPGHFTPEMRAAISADKRANNPMKRPEVVAKVRESLERNGTKMAGIKSFWADPERSAAARAAASKRMREDNPMFRIDIREKSLSQTRQHLKPSQLEEWFGRLCLRHEIPVWYTGTGEFWVHGRNPDFKIHDSRLLIEVTDGYSRKPQRRTVENYATPTITHYESHGWRCLVVMLPARRGSRTPELQAALVEAIQTFISTEQSAVWSFHPQT